MADAIGARPPTFIHIPTDARAQLAPEQAAITVENLQFNNIFDNMAARTDLGFRTTITWREGARRMVAWLDAHDQIADSDGDPFEDQLIARWRQGIDRAASIVNHAPTEQA